MPDRIVGTRRLLDDWFSVEKVSVELAGGETVERIVAVHPSGAVVLAYDRARRVAMLATQARPPVLREGEAGFVEVIGGAIEDGDAEACVRREAMEEAGLRLGALEKIGIVWPTPATSTERLHLFLAAYSPEDRVAEGGGLAEEAEHLGLHEMPLARLAALADAGELRDAKTLLLVQTLRLREPGLFA